MTTLDEIKARQQVTWSTGDYGKVAATTLPFGDILVEAVDIRPSTKVIDVATGTGHVALAAARRFCDATGVDYVPALIEAARRRAEAEGLDATFVEGDAEALDFPDGTFDYVFSAIGAMFAPNHQKVADELVRVCKPGGTIAMANWTADGFAGELFKVVGAHNPPPPGVTPPAKWAEESYVRDLFGDRVTDLTVTPRELTMRYPSAEFFADYFIRYFGPVATAAAKLDDPSPLRDDLMAHVTRFNSWDGPELKIEAAFVIVRATRGAR